ncbi:hypothetical protein HIM_02972 [Hirsutella minnesotensis 3608]|nr:hypothetical protein HIM_02972 [Hirsutella minnesotensis 3608]
MSNPLCLYRKVASNIEQCNVLSSLLPGTIAFSSSTTYLQENRYWSNRQAEVRPRCFFAPRNTLHVSQAMKVLTSLKAHFTVKAGGHTAFAGGSNIDGGVTIDLAHLNDITVWPDRETVSVGSGNRWINVSSALDPVGLAVAGGRAADVGVAGLSLGGGISYFSGTRGWACDNVRNYEIVISSGEIVNASPKVNADLYWALRGGGGSNFGIVTRFDLESFEQGGLWANGIVFPGALNKTLIPLFTDLSNKGLVEDQEAHTYFVLSYQPDLRGFVVLTSFYHATPPPVNTTPPVFEPFQSVPGAISNVVQLTNISAQSKAIDQPSGSRQTWWDTSVAMTSPDLLQDIVSLYEKLVHKFLAAANETSIATFLVFQPVSQNIIDAMQKNGGNALGLKPEGGPLMIVQITVTWAQKNLDTLIEESTEAFIREV